MAQRIYCDGCKKPLFVVNITDGEPNHMAVLENVPSHLRGTDKHYASSTHLCEDCFSIPKAMQMTRSLNLKESDWKNTTVYNVYNHGVTDKPFLLGSKASVRFHKYRLFDEPEVKDLKKVICQSTEFNPNEISIEQPKIKFDPRRIEVRFGLRGNISRTWVRYHNGRSEVYHNGHSEVYQTAPSGRIFDISCEFGLPQKRARDAPNYNDMKTMDVQCTHVSREPAAATKLVQFAADPLIEIITAALMLAPATQDCKWTSSNKTIQKFFDMPKETLQSLIETLRGLTAIQIGIATSENVREKFLSIFGNLNGLPALHSNQFALLTQFKLLLTWKDMNLQARNGSGGVACSGGSAETLPYRVSGFDGLCTREGVPTFIVDHCEYTIYLTPLPYAAGSELDDLATKARSQHLAGTPSVSCESNPNAVLELLPVYADGQTCDMGILGRLAGAETSGGFARVEHVNGAFATRVDVDGIAAKTGSVVVVSLRGMSRPAEFLMHDKQGNGSLLMTIRGRDRVLFSYLFMNKDHIEGS
jgi:hypothetical protein